MRTVLQSAGCGHTHSTDLSQGTADAPQTSRLPVRLWESRTHSTVLSANVSTTILEEQDRRQAILGVTTEVDPSDQDDQIWGDKQN